MPSLEAIINTGSGSTDKEQVLPLLASLFTAAGIEFRISMVDSGAKLADLAQSAARGDAQSIIAGGGDGTVSAVASALVGSNKTFGILPLGTLNHFAKDLGIPLDPAEAARTIIAGHTTLIDVGEVNGNIFINNSSLGFYPQVVQEREVRRRLGSGKWPAFLRAALTVLRRHPFMNVRLIVNGEEIVARTPFVFIGNNEYEMEGFNIGGRERLDAGRLSLYVTHQTSRAWLLSLGVRAMLGRLGQADDFVALHTTELWIEMRRKRVRVSRDGEVGLLDTPLHYRIRPAALRVIVPSPAEEPE